MITVNAMFTAENMDNIVEMGMITYTATRPSNTSTDPTKRAVASATALS